MTPGDGPTGILEKQILNKHGFKTEGAEGVEWGHQGGLKAGAT